MSVKVMSLVFGMDLPPNQKFVLLALADHADHDGQNIHPGVPLIAKKTNYSEREVFRIIKGLLSCGRLAVQEALPGKKVIYCIPDPCQIVTPTPCQSVTPDKVTPLTSDALTPDICDSGPLTSDAIPPHPPIRKNRPLEPSITVKESRRGSRPVDVTEVKAYGQDIGLPPDQCQDFWEFYENNGWKQSGRTPMKDWKLAASRWKRRWQSSQPKGSTGTQQSDPDPDRKHPREGIDYVLVAKGNEPARRYNLDRTTIFDEPAWRRERGQAA